MSFWNELSDLLPCFFQNAQAIHFRLFSTLLTPPDSFELHIQTLSKFRHASPHSFNIDVCSSFSSTSVSIQKLKMINILGSSYSKSSILEFLMQKGLCPFLAFTVSQNHVENQINLMRQIKEGQKDKRTIEWTYIHTDTREIRHIDRQIEKISQVIGTWRRSKNQTVKKIQ